MKIATSENDGEIVDAPTPTSGVSILQPRVASSLPFGVVATPGKSTIGKDLTIIGQGVRIISKGRLQIDGDIYADIIGSDLTISTDGSVIGTVSAERVNVFGRVKGEIRARIVILHPTAHVEAAILPQTLEIAEGAYFDGRVSRCRDVADLRPNLDLPLWWAAGWEGATSVWSAGNITGKQTSNRCCATGTVDGSSRWISIIVRSGSGTRPLPDIHSERIFEFVHGV